MTSIKLTVAIRKSISDRVLRDKYEKRYTDLAARFKTLAEDVYNDVYSKKDRDLMASLPKGWLVTGKYIYVRFEAHCSYETLHFNGGCGYRSMRYQSERLEKLIPAKDRDRCMKVYEPTCKFTVQYVACRAALKQLDEDFDTSNQMLTTTLARFKTLDALKKQWPEIVPFTDHIEESRINTLPAVRMSEINKQLGL